jgi:hypothetical protein
MVRVRHRIENLFCWIIVWATRKVMELSKLGLQSEGARTFADYWQSLPKVDLIPMRTSFDPAAIKDLLPHMAIHDLSVPERIHVRLAGTSIVEGFGREIKDTDFLDYFEPEQRANALKYSSIVTDYPCGKVVRILVQTTSGSVLQDESIGFPMRDNNGLANLIYYHGNRKPHADDANFDARADNAARLQVIERLFIDIGSGVPALEL